MKKLLVAALFCSLIFSQKTSATSPMGSALSSTDNSPPRISVSESSASHLASQSALLQTAALATSPLTITGPEKVDRMNTPVDYQITSTSSQDASRANDTISRFLDITADFRTSASANLAITSGDCSISEQRVSDTYYFKLTVKQGPCAAKLTVSFQEQGYSLLTVSEYYPKGGSGLPEPVSLYPEIQPLAPIINNPDQTWIEASHESGSATVTCSDPYDNIYKDDHDKQVHQMSLEASASGGGTVISQRKEVLNLKFQNPSPSKTTVISYQVTCTQSYFSAEAPAPKYPKSTKRFTFTFKGDESKKSGADQTPVVKNPPKQDDEPAKVPPQEPPIKQPPPPPPPPSDSPVLRLFVSSKVYTGGALGSLESMRNECRDLAKENKLGGTDWDVFGSDTNNAVKDRVQDGASFVRVDRKDNLKKNPKDDDDGQKLIAKTKQQLLSEIEKERPVLRTEKEGKPYLYFAGNDGLPWTGSDASGAPTKNTCQDWSSNQLTGVGDSGHAHKKDKNLLENASKACAEKHPIYCFERSSSDPELLTTSKQPLKDTLLPSVINATEKSSNTVKKPLPKIVPKSKPRLKVVPKKTLPKGK